MGWYDWRYAVAWVTILGLVILLALWPEPIDESELLPQSGVTP
jgi:predicted MFS family arabinose efflux permease